MGKQKLEEEHRYHAWKADSLGNPIENTDRVLIGPSKRWVLNHLATEEGIELKVNYGTVVRLPDGNFWCVSKLF